MAKKLDHIEKSGLRLTSIHEVTQSRPNISDGMEEIVPSVIPFVPPKVDDSGKEEAKFERHGLPVIKRIYTELETHYPEEPISALSQQNPPSSIYMEARIVTEGWEKCRPWDQDYRYNSSNGSYGGMELKTTASSQKETFEKVDTKSKKAASSSEADLADELAHTSLGYQSPTSMTEGELCWKNGQTDYMGQDAFENILRKLDETLNKVGPPVPLPNMSSPFTPREERKMTKEVVLKPDKTGAIAPLEPGVAEPPKMTAIAKIQATFAVTDETAAAPKSSEPKPNKATALTADKTATPPTVKTPMNLTGQNSFFDIQKKLDETLNHGQPAAPPSSISNPFIANDKWKEPTKEVVLEPNKTDALAPPEPGIAAPPKMIAVAGSTLQTTIASKSSEPEPYNSTAPPTEQTPVPPTATAASKAKITAAPKVNPVPVTRVEAVEVAAFESPDVIPIFAVSSKSQ